MAAAVGMAVLAAGTEEGVIRAALAGMALMRVGRTLALAGMAVAVTGTVVTGTAWVVAGIMVATVVVGELAPRLVSGLALDYSGERWRPLPIMVATTMATITRRMPVHRANGLVLVRCLSGLLSSGTGMSRCVAASCSVTRNKIAVRCEKA